MHSPVPLLLLLLCTAAAASDHGSQSQVRHVTSAASVSSSPTLTLTRPPRSPAAIPAHIASRRAQAQAPGAARLGLVPVAPAEAELGTMALALNDTRRRLGGSFQLCAPCTCCGGASGSCVLAPCCYSINCNIPNRPFGYCSFTPKSCECIGCNL